MQQLALIILDILLVHLDLLAQRCFFSCYLPNPMTGDPNALQQFLCLVIVDVCLQHIMIARTCLASVRTCFLSVLALSSSIFAFFFRAFDVFSIARTLPLFPCSNTIAELETFTACQSQETSRQLIYLLVVTSRSHQQTSSCQQQGDQRQPYPCPARRPPRLRNFMTSHHLSSRCLVAATSRLGSSAQGRHALRA
eukprot:762722-Hanusia_phi.AAC.1